MCECGDGTGAYIGVEADYSFKSDLKARFSDGAVERVKDDQVGLGLKAGYDFGASKKGSDNDGWWEDKWKTHKFIVGADICLKLQTDLKPYLAHIRVFLS